ncbi:uncharacterized protein LOC131927925 [Physella acuta]|uniref:uncharacterized protein LOC131927925 n=1 Tax=Physella acuta TaxID=109671 RepID=UPI0027DE5095|nr:uncharacterized protein LOC131927925 [Physella acuta]
MSRNRKHVRRIQTLINQFQEETESLQMTIDNYFTTIFNEANQWVTKPGDSNKSFKEMSTLLKDGIQCVMGTMGTTSVKSMRMEKNENEESDELTDESYIQNNGRHYSTRELTDLTLTNILSRLEKLEATHSSVQGTQLVENTETKAWRNNLVLRQRENEIQIEMMTHQHKQDLYMLKEEVKEFGVVCKMLQRGLISMSQILNQRSGDRKRYLDKLKDIKKDVSNLKTVLHSCCQYLLTPTAIGFIASDGYESLNHDIVYRRVERNVGNYFNVNTGRFVVPVYGRYITSLTIEQRGWYEDKVNAKTERYK